MCSSMRPVPLLTSFPLFWIVPDSYNPFFSISGFLSCSNILALHLPTGLVLPLPASKPPPHNPVIATGFSLGYHYFIKL